MVTPLTDAEFQTYAQWWQVAKMISVSNSFDQMGHDGYSGREYNNSMMIGMEIGASPFTSEQVFATLLEKNFDVRMPFEMFTHILETLEWYSFTPKESKIMCDYLERCGFSIFLIIMSRWHIFDLASMLGCLDDSYHRYSEIMHDLLYEMKMHNHDKKYIRMIEDLE